ncbi:MAG: hypothetical protein ACR2GB_08490, partial [Nocardioidaceae bacterium]
DGEHVTRTADRARRFPPDCQQQGTTISARLQQRTRARLNPDGFSVRRRLRPAASRHNGDVQPSRHQAVA